MARVTLRVTLLALTFAVLACLTLAKSPDRVEFLPGYGNVTTTQYAGQLSVSDSKDSQLFYWFFENDANPLAPVLLWLNGGPGCSSLSAGLFNELGPYHFTDSQSSDLMDNPYSWTKAGVHLLFIDQPIGTGLSFMSANATYLTNEEETTAQLYSALVYFFTKLHPKFALVDFYISGESYAGKYIPRLTDYILARQSKRDTISHAFPLKGIIIGNGLTHPIVQRTAAVEQAYAASLIGLDQKLQLQSVIDGCKRRIASENWLAAVDYCESILKFVNVATGHSAGLEELDLYNYYELGPMYNRTQVEGYLNTVEFRQAVHITDDIVANPFHACNGDLAEALQPWILRSVLPLLPRILSKDVKVMFYGGNVDLKDGPIGTELFLTSAIGSSASIMSSWEGYQSFIDAPRRVWTVNSKIAGWIRSGGNLSFVTVRSAGHAVPKDQNVNSLEMIRRFLELSPSNQQFCEGYAGCLPRAEVGPVLCTALQNCSGHGSCNNDTGLCICDPEWSNADCSVQVQPLTLGMPITAATSAYEWGLYEIAIIDAARFQFLLDSPLQSSAANANLTFTLYVDSNPVNTPLPSRRHANIALSADSFTHVDKGNNAVAQQRSIIVSLVPGKYRVGVYTSIHSASTVQSCTTPISYTLTVLFSSETGAPIAPDYNDHRGSIVIISILAIVAGVSTISTIILGCKVSRDSKKEGFQPL